jgi:hypothetical protein
MEQVDLLGYGRQKNKIYDDYSRQSAANAFGRQQAQQRGSRDLGDFTQGFQRTLPKFTAGFGRRGLAGGGVQSGVMRQAMQDYVGDYTKQLGYMQGDMSDSMHQFDLNQAGFTASRDSALDGLEADKTAMIAQTAANISALKPYMGGY